MVLTDTWVLWFYTYHLSGWKSLAQLLYSPGYVGDSFRRMRHDWAAGKLTFTTILAGIQKTLWFELRLGGRGSTVRWRRCLAFPALFVLLLHAGILACPDLWGRDIGLGPTPCTSTSFDRAKLSKAQRESCIVKTMKKNGNKTVYNGNCHLKQTQLDTLPFFSLMIFVESAACCHVSWKLKVLKVLSCCIWSSDPALGAADLCVGSLWLPQTKALLPLLWRQIGEIYGQRRKFWILAGIWRGQSTSKCLSAGRRPFRSTENDCL